MIEDRMRLAPLAMALALSACGRAEAPHAPSSTPPAIPSRSACFLLYDMGVGEVRRAPAEACTTRISPASTFKIPHALAALDSGVLAGPDVSFPYDGNAHEPETWKRAHTLASAMRYSVVWYFQRIATMLGREREREYLAAFWLGASLRISPEEQERFLVRLYEDALPVSKDAMRTVRDILIQPADVVVNAAGAHPFDAPWPADAIVSAKTGRADDVSWLVGHVKRGGRAWVFVSCVLGPTESDPMAAMNLAATSLRDARVL
jgi:beta-lactamase class D